MYGYDHFAMGLGGFGMILVWLVPLLLLVLLFRRYSGGGERRQGKTALEILEARYARGEIDQEEYQKRRADLAKMGDAAGASLYPRGSRR